MFAVTTCFMQQRLSAQTDSAYLDLPRFRVSRSSVQSFTIKGEELAKMPFTDFSQAIGVWVGPALATGSTIVYVVDGQMVNDVNIYSIHDIESITFLQSGLIQLTGGTVAHQNIVLLTTKKNVSNKWQLQGAASTAFVNRGDSSAKAGLFHQYNVSASNGSEKLNYGVSAGFLHDMMPQPETARFEKNSSLHQNRYRANAWLGGVFLHHHQFRLDAAYVTQKQSNAYTLLQPTSHSNTGTWKKDHVLNIKASIASSFEGGFGNRVYADFYDYHLQGNITSIDNADGFSGYTLTTEEPKLRNWMVGNRFSYDKQFHRFYLAASLDVQYRHVDYNYNNLAFRTFSTSSNPATVTVSTYWEGTYAKNWFIAPTVNFGVDSLLNMQAGAVAIYHPLRTAIHENRVLPFGAASFDVLKSINRNSPVSLRLYTSVAAISSMPELGWANLSNLTTQQNLLMDYNSLKARPWASFDPYQVYADVRYVHFQGGVRLGLWQNKLIADYTYDKNQSVSPQQPIYTVPGGYGFGGSVSQPPRYLTTNYTRHRLAISAQTDIGKLHWLSVATMYYIRSKTEQAYYSVVTKDNFYTTGWANRFTLGTWQLGVDAVGVFNKAYVGGKHKSIALQQVNVGRKFTHGYVSYDVFAFTRTPFDNKQYPLFDQRRYYGIGCNIGL